MNYHARVEFEWDEAKSDACLAQRGFDFAYALQVFFDPHRLIRQDHRWDYGEERYQLLGMVEQRVFFRRLHRPKFGYSHHFGAKGQSP